VDQSLIDKLGISYIEEKATKEKPEISIKYTVIIEYYILHKNQKLVIIGKNSSPMPFKEAYKKALQDLTEKCPSTIDNSQFSIRVLEQVFGPIKTTNFSMNNYTIQPISSHWLTWDQLKRLLAL
jgi:hypothetical protein